MLKKICFAALCGALAACLIASEARAQDGRIDASEASLSEQEALAVLNDHFATQPRILTSCSGDYTDISGSRVTQYAVSTTGVRVSLCNGSQQLEMRFSTFTQVVRCPGGLCVSAGRNNSIRLYDVRNREAFTNAWLSLARAPPRDPATDAAFQSALQTARAGGLDRTEEHRRVQVQVEALIAANQNAQAAALYRDALEASPDWANGHYNLALLAGELGDHVEAITAMRRYLYLEPNAPDARAAQDQIYRWEALLPAR